MRTLNDIPDYLRQPDKGDWTPGRGLLKGATWILVTTAVITIVLCTITFHFPVVATHWLLNLGAVFIVTWLLFVVMYRAAGMACPTGTVIVVAHVVFLVVARHVAVLMYVVEARQAAIPVWSLLNPIEVLWVNLPAWIGLGLGTYFCKDGEGTLHELANMLMVNPFTGRRT